MMQLTHLIAFLATFTLVSPYDHSASTELTDNPLFKVLSTALTPRDPTVLLPGQTRSLPIFAGDYGGHSYEIRGTINVRDPLASNIRFS